MTKSRIREAHPKPTLGETEELLKKTVLPLVNLPEQTMAERVIELNRLVRQHGIIERDLVFVIEKNDLTRERPISKMKTPPMAIRKIPLAVAMKFIQDTTLLRYKVTGGQVECWNGRYLPQPPREPAADSAGDPFAEREN